jgi:hypothetical protein
LQGAFTELESIREEEYALTEKQKVSIFTKGLVAEEYAATKKHSIHQNEEIRSDFQKCYAFVETMEQFKTSYANTSSFDRNVLETGSKKGIDKGYRSPAQRAALSKEEKDKILSARGSSKKSGDRKGKKGKKPENNKRNLESFVTEAAEAISAITDDTDTTGTDGNSSQMD